MAAVKKNPVLVQVSVLFAGTNDIIHGWTINTVIFPKACYRLWESHCTMDDAPSNQKINLFSKFKFCSKSRERRHFHCFNALAFSKQAVKALVRLCVCTSSFEPSL